MRDVPVTIVVNTIDRAAYLRRLLASFFPEIAFLETGDGLNEAWRGSADTPAIVEFGLGNEFMLPLESDFALDPFNALIDAMSELRDSELALYQVLFEPARNEWAESAWRIVAFTANAARRTLSALLLLCVSAPSDKMMIARRFSGLLDNTSAARKMASLSTVIPFALRSNACSLISWPLEKSWTSSNSG